MGYDKGNDSDIVTIFGRKSFTMPVDETGRQKPIQIPDVLHIQFPDRTWLSVPTSDSIIIGRRPRPDDPEVTVDLEGHDGRAKGVSRHHAMIKAVKDALMLVDLDSINGTFINGEKAIATKRYVLVDGDEVTVGKIVLKLSFSKPD